MSEVLPALAASFANFSFEQFLASCSWKPECHASFVSPVDVAHGPWCGIPLVDVGATGVIAPTKMKNLHLAIDLFQLVVVAEQI